MFIYLLLAFTLLPIAEIMVLVRINRLIHFGPTILLVVATGVFGAALARREWHRTWIRLQQRLQRGEAPTDELLDGVLIFAAGLVLVTPGVITDVVGLLLLVPPVRRFVRQGVKRRVSAQMVIMGPTHGPSPDGVRSSPDNVGSSADSVGSSADSVGSSLDDVGLAGSVPIDAEFREIPTETRDPD